MNSFKGKKTVIEEKKKNKLLTFLNLNHMIWNRATTSGRQKAEVIHAKCRFCFAITALSSEKVVHHVFCHDSAAQQVVLCRGSLYSHSLFKAAAHVAPRGAAATVVVVGPV